MRRHGWQRPLHPLQMVGMSIYCFLVISFFFFGGLFLGSRKAGITVITIFSTVALSVMILFVRCTAIDPTDKTHLKRRKKKGKPNGFPKIKYGFMLGQMLMRFVKRLERKVLRAFIRRKYLDPWQGSGIIYQKDPFLLPFPLVLKNEDSAISPNLVDDDDVSFCSICYFEVKKHSKHCRSCNRCVEGFDHHCKWLNNCVGKKNYTTFFLLMIFVLLMLIIEGGTSIAVFIRCFSDKKGIKEELKRTMNIDFPRGVLAAINVLLFLLTAYGSAALAQLFFFHVVLIKKGMRTYDYVMAMREENLSMNELESSSDDSDFLSDDDYDDDDEIILSDSSSLEKPSPFYSRFICKESSRLSIRIDGNGEGGVPRTQRFRAGINPWKLISMSKDKAISAAQKAKEKLMNNNNNNNNLIGKQQQDQTPKPLPLETKSGPLSDSTLQSSGTTPLISKIRAPKSPRRLSSPRRRFSNSFDSPTTTTAPLALTPKQRYKSNFDLKLTEVSKEMETYISKQVLFSVIKDGGGESPR